MLHGRDRDGGWAAYVKGCRAGRIVTEQSFRNNVLAGMGELAGVFSEAKCRLATASGWCGDPCRCA